MALRGGHESTTDSRPPPLKRWATRQLVLVHGRSQAGIRVELDAGLHALLEPLAGLSRLIRQQADLTGIVIGFAELLEVLPRDAIGNLAAGLGKPEAAVVALSKRAVKALRRSMGRRDADATRKTTGDNAAGSSRMADGPITPSERAGTPPRWPPGAGQSSPSKRLTTSSRNVIYGR